MRKIDPFHYGRIEKDEVNQQAVQNYFQLIDEAEAFYNAQIRRVVEQMGGGQDRATVICLSGPSASGKTTTAHTLARHFISSGRKAMVISLDDFYMDTEQTPLNRKGKPDFESIYALDIERINRCIKELIEQGGTNIPIFDFHIRKRLEGMEREIAFRLTPMPELLERACLRLGGTPMAGADVSFSLPFFEELRIAVQFWHGDDEFAPRLRVLWDANADQYLRYETMYYAIGLLKSRLRAYGGE